MRSQVPRARESKFFCHGQGQKHHGHDEGKIESTARERIDNARNSEVMQLFGHLICASGRTQRRTPLLLSYSSHFSTRLSQSSIDNRKIMLSTLVNRLSWTYQ